MKKRKIQFIFLLFDVCRHLDYFCFDYLIFYETLMISTYFINFHSLEKSNKIKLWKFIKNNILIG